MESVAAKQETTINARLVGVLPGDPPKINLVAHASGRNGSKRHFTRQISIPDDSLFVRLKQEASVGDHLRVTVVNEYRETGSVTCLTDFKKVPDSETVSIVKNGTINTTHTDVNDETIIPPVRRLKATVEH